MPPGSGDREYGEAFDAVVEPLLRSYKPNMLIVSAGQDCHAADTLSNQMVSAAGFRMMAERCARVASDRGIGLVVLHEGGYNVSTLPQLDHAILGGLGGFETPTNDLFAEGALPAEGWAERLSDVRKQVARCWTEVE
jgi:acetoin utilization deacetylase AcuC-like enzyme